MTPESRQLALLTARSLLFVPGNRPERFAKAEAARPDLTILDLEDAVPADQKEASLTQVLSWVEHHDRAIVRINSLASPWAAHELDALRGSGVPVMLPKAESEGDVIRVHEATGGAPVLALIETARGVQAAHALAASGAVARLVLGNVDLAASLGVDPASRAALAPARGALVLASAAAELPGPIDGVTTNLDDPARLIEDVRHAREVGFAGRLCIHPRQVGPTTAGMSPTPAEVAWAERVVASAVEGVSVLDGAMVDAPVIARARSILARVNCAAD